MTNTPNNQKDSGDEIVISLVIFVPDVGSGLDIEVTAVTEYMDAVSPATLMDSETAITVIPDLLILGSNTPATRVDAGDSLQILFVVYHDTLTSLVDAQRVNVTLSYPNSLLLLNESSPSFQLLVEEDLIDVGSVVTDAETGTVSFRTNDSPLGQAILATVQYELTNDVESGSTIELNYQLDWHSLPFEYNGGRAYSTSGVHQVSK